MLITFQVVMCLVLLLLAAWHLNHMGEDGGFTLRWSYLGALSLALLGAATCANPHPLFYVTASVLSALSGVHYAFLQPTRLSGHDRRVGDRRATAE